jgi:hypothetical protein
MVVRVLGNCMSCRLKHSMKASSPSDVTPSGTTIDSRFIQVPKANWGISCKVFGRLTEERLWQNEIRYHFATAKKDCQMVTASAL